MKFLLIFFCCINFANAAVWNKKIFNTKAKKEISHLEYIQDLADFSIIALGEEHYNPIVQMVEANTISDVVLFTKKQNTFTTAWEFLNVTEQPQINHLFNQLKKKEITALNFIEKTQGKSPAPEGYAEVIERTARLGGDLLGTNLTREEKTPVTRNGIEALDPKLLPPNFDYGTRGYYERFVQMMEGHATPEQIKNYYASQCLVDDVMAYHVLKDTKTALNFIVAGSFHTDFYDGAVNRMKLRYPGIDIVTVKIVDASEYEESDLLAIMHDEKYGDIADYVYFVRGVE